MDELLIKAIIAATMVSLNASIAGTLTVFRRASFLVAGSAHSALAGVAVALFLNSVGVQAHYFLFALIASLLAATIAARSSRLGDINTGIATTFALSMAVVGIFISLANYSASAWQFLFGDILLLTNEDVALIAASTTIVIVVASLLYHKFLFISFDPSGAEAVGLNVGFYDFILISLISASVVSAMKAVGAILVFSIFIAPSATAKYFGRSTGSVFIIAFLVALVSMYGGVVISLLYPIPAGAMAALLASFLYFVPLVRGK